MIVGPETCDDGNTIPADGCSDICVVEPTAFYCGDGVVSGSEECDDGAANGTVGGADGCTIGCQIPPYCGDGVVDANLGEQCDEGALNGNGDGNCSANCFVVIFI